ncbi:MAG: pyridoxal-phosphate dependent enzyme [Acidobacteriia bacterium]|nr:pyridoxal-phosphate dependent enzyme [Terriglobia bacterium]
MDFRISQDDLAEARATIAGLVHRTPVFSSRALSRRTGLSVYLKAENLQKTGSFKPRGAFNKVRHLPRAEARRGIITASAGNMGQAVAYVAAHEQIPGVVVMPERANSSKVAAVKEYGAEAIQYGRLWDDAFARSQELAIERGLVYVHPFKDRHVLAGQGTLALEVLEDLPDLAAIVIPIGGGGLMAGMAMALKLHKPEVRIIGVEPTGSANMFLSRRQGRCADLDEVTTIADGLATRKTDPEVFEIINDLVDELVTVEDAEMLQAIRFLLERAKLLAEPAGAATVAALLAGKVALPPDTVTVAVVSGGNLDVAGRLELTY